MRDFLPCLAYVAILCLIAWAAFRVRRAYVRQIATHGHASPWVARLERVRAYAASEAFDGDREAATSKGDRP